MKHPYLHLLLVLFAFAGGGSGHARAADIVELNRIVAVVNDSVITEAQLKERIFTITLQLRQNNTPLPPRDVLRRQVLERLVMEQVQLDMAQRTGVQVNDEQVNEVITNIARNNKLSLQQFRQVLERDGIDFSSFRENIHNEIVLNRLRARQVDSRVNVSEQEIDEFLQNQLIQGTLDIEYKLSHILIAMPEAAKPEVIASTRDKAQRVLDELHKGIDFRQQAVAYSDGQQALQGGDLGWRKAAQLPTLFTESIARMSVGEVSDLIRSPSGFHILKLDERRGGQRSIIEQNLSRHILIQTNALVSDTEARRKLERLRARILDGEDFAELARANSDDTGSASHGGELGWANPGMYVPAFEEAIASLKVGQISEPFKSRFGWHLLQVLERRKHDNTETQQRTRAHKALRERKADEAFQSWLRQLRDESYVEYRLEG